MKSDKVLQSETVKDFVIGQRTKKSAQLTLFGGAIAVVLILGVVLYLTDITAGSVMAWTIPATILVGMLVVFLVLQAILPKDCYYKIEVDDEDFIFVFSITNTRIIKRDCVVRRNGEEILLYDGRAQFPVAYTKEVECFLNKYNLCELQEEHSEQEEQNVTNIREVG